MGQVGGHTLGIDDIVANEGLDQGAKLQEEGEGLRVMIVSVIGILGRMDCGGGVMLTYLANATGSSSNDLFDNSPQNHNEGWWVSIEPLACPKPHY